MRFVFLSAGVRKARAALVPTASAADWGQWLGPKRDAVWEEKGLVTKFPKDGPTVVWRRPIGAGYAGPAVVGKRLYIMDRVPAKLDPDKPAPKGTQPGAERVLCLNVADGKTVWAHSYDCTYANVSYPTGPRTTPVLDGTRLYALGTMGDLQALSRHRGRVGRLVEELREGLSGARAGVGLVRAPVTRRRHARRARRR